MAPQQCKRSGSAFEVSKLKVESLPCGSTSSLETAKRQCLWRSENESTKLTPELGAELPMEELRRIVQDVALLLLCGGPERDDVIKAVAE